MGRERRAGRYATPMSSRWMVDTVLWLVNDVGRKRRGNGCGAWLARARLRLPSEPTFISFYKEWRHRRHPMSARGLRTCSHVWRMDKIPCVFYLRRWSRQGWSRQAAIRGRRSRRCMATGNLVIDVRTRRSGLQLTEPESGQVAGPILGVRAPAQSCRRENFASRHIRIPAREASHVRVWSAHGCRTFDGSTKFRPLLSATNVAGRGR